MPLAEWSTRGPRRSQMPVSNSSLGAASSDSRAARRQADHCPVVVSTSDLNLARDVSMSCPVSLECHRMECRPGVGGRPPCPVASGKNSNPEDSEGVHHGQRS